METPQHMEASPVADRAASERKAGAKGETMRPTKKQRQEVRREFSKADSAGNACDDCEKPARHGWWRRASYEYDEWDCRCFACAYKWMHRFDDFQEE